MYLDLVVAKHKDSPRYYLFQAPPFSRLNAGELVIVDTVKGEAEAEVVNVLTTDTNRKEYHFIVEMNHATLPLRKVLKKVAYRELRYEEEQE